LAAWGQFGKEEINEHESKKKREKNARTGLTLTGLLMEGPEVVPGIVAVVIRLYLVERKSAIGPIGHFDWDGPQRRQLFVQWTIRFVRVREPHRRGRNG
jgi:hypothetical protein